MVLYVKIFKKFDDFCFVNFFIFTINVPVVFMARYVMVLRGATSLRGALEGVGPENRDFQGPPLSMPRIMMLHPSKSLHTAP